jgi:phosphatidylinositol alpha-1,6-mannosyltransferase
MSFSEAGPLRVAILITEAFRTAGGVQLVNRSIAEVMAGHPRFTTEFFSVNDDPRTCGSSEMPFHAFDGRSVRFVLGVCGAFLTRRYDLLLVTHRNLLPLALFWKSVTGRPYVLFGHGIEIWPRQTPLYRFALHMADLVLTNSRFTRDRLCVSNGLPAERTEVVGLCVGNPSEPASCGGSNAPLLLTVGRAAAGEAYKGQDTVIRALPQILGSFPSVRYVVAGGGDDLPRLRSLAQETRVDSSIDFLGPVSEEQKDGLYRSATIFVMPSRGEGFGLVFLEAMGYRLPCIAGNSDASVETVRDGINGFTVDPGDAEAVAGATLRLLGDPPLRVAMGHAGRAIKDAEFSCEAFSERLAGALDRAVARPR